MSSASPTSVALGAVGPHAADDDDAAWPPTTSRKMIGTAIGTASSPTAYVAFPLMVSGDRFVGERQTPLDRREDGRDLESTVSDHPQRTTLVLHRPPGDEVLLHPSEAQQVTEFVGDFLVLSEKDANVGQVEQVLRDLRRLRTGVAGRERVGRLVVGHQLDVAVVAGEPQVGVESLDRFDAEASLHPRLVAQDDPAVTRLGHLANPLAPGVEANQGDADGALVAGRVERVERQRLDRGAPVRLKRRGRVEEPLELALAQRPQGVTQRPTPVQEVLPAVVAARLDELSARVV